MNRFDLDKGMGIRGLTGSKPPSFQYQNDPIRDAIASRQDANDSMNRATDQYEADVADFKDTIAREKEQGIAGLPQMDDMINMPPPMENKPPYIAELPPPVFDDNPFKGIFEPPFTPPMDDPIFEPPFTPPMDDPIFVPPKDEPPFTPPIDKPPFTPPFEPPFTPPIDKPPFTPPFEPPIDTPPPGYNPPGQPYEPPYDDRIDEDPPYVPPIDTPPPGYTPPPPKPINYYTNETINNPYTPYATDSGATPLTKAISPRDFGRAPGIMFPTPTPIFKPPRLPGKPPDRPRISEDPTIFGAKHGGALNRSLNKGIMRLPQSQQGDTMTTQMFQRAFRPRR
jgi:hypothetical protein